MRDKWTDKVLLERRCQRSAYKVAIGNSPRTTEVGPDAS